MYYVFIQNIIRIYNISLYHSLNFMKFCWIFLLQADISSLIMDNLYLRDSIMESRAISQLWHKRTQNSQMELWVEDRHIAYQHCLEQYQLFANLTHSSTWFVLCNCAEVGHNFYSTPGGRTSTGHLQWNIYRMETSTVVLQTSKLET